MFEDYLFPDLCGYHNCRVIPLVHDCPCANCYPLHKLECLTCEEPVKRQREQWIEQAQNGGQFTDEIEKCKQCIERAVQQTALVKSA